jgi:hypothetical protein
MDIKELPVQKPAAPGHPKASPAPIATEFLIINKIPPAALKTKVTKFLSGYGVKKKSEFVDKTMSKPGAILYVGLPKLYTVKAGKFVVWTVLNPLFKGYDVDGFPGSEAVNLIKDDFKNFENKPKTGLYLENTNGTTHESFMKAVLKQKFVQDEESGVSFLSNGVAMTFTPDNIILNAHSPGFTSSVYHELLHTYDGEAMANTLGIREGVVEYFGKAFAVADGFAGYQVYGGYKDMVDEATKIIKAVGEAEVARAYFDDNEVEIKKIADWIDPEGDAFKSLKPAERLSPAFQTEWLKCGEIKRAIANNAKARKSKK